MRITNQMMARASAKSGIPLQQTSMLNYLQNMNKTGSQTLLSSLGNTTQTNSLLRSISKKNSLQLESSAESLSDYAAKLAGNGDDSLFAKAEQSGDTSEIIATAERMAESYNKTIKSLKNSDSTLNKFYLQELSGYTAGQSDALKAVGITRNKDGSLSIQKDTLKSADLDSLKKAFGVRFCGKSKLRRQQGGTECGGAWFCGIKRLQQYRKRALQFICQKHV